MQTTSLLAGGALFLAALSAADPGWHPHEGGLLKYRVSAVVADSAGQVYVFHRPTNPALGSSWWRWEMRSSCPIRGRLQNLEREFTRKTTNKNTKAATVPDSSP